MLQFFGSEIRVSATDDRLTLEVRLEDSAYVTEAHVYRFWDRWIEADDAMHVFAAPFDGGVARRGTPWASACPVCSTGSESALACFSCTLY